MDTWIRRYLYKWYCLELKGPVRGWSEASENKVLMQKVDATYSRFCGIHCPGAFVTCFVDAISVMGRQRGGPVVVWGDAVEELRMKLFKDITDCDGIILGGSDIKVPGETAVPETEV